jgi:hypothetical protein
MNANANGTALRLVAPPAAGPAARRPLFVALSGDQFVEAGDGLGIRAG